MDTYEMKDIRLRPVPIFSHTRAVSPKSAVRETKPQISSPTECILTILDPTS